jgi:hypothetical protein
VRDRPKHVVRVSASARRYVAIAVNLIYALLLCGNAAVSGGSTCSVNYGSPTFATMQSCVASLPEFLREAIATTGKSDAIWHPRYWLNNSRVYFTEVGGGVGWMECDRIPRSIYEQEQLHPQ